VNAERNNNMVLGITGLALVVGFFMPWIDVGGLHGVSGWDMVCSEQLSLITRIILALCPLGGAVLALSAFGRSNKAAQLGLAVGAGVLGYTFYKLAYGFIKVTGAGLWMVLAGATVALAIGLLTRPASK
jgi:hypothetical protein